MKNKIKQSLPQILLVAGLFAILTGVNIFTTNSANITGSISNISLSSGEKFYFSSDSGLVIFQGDSIVVASKSSAPSTPHTGQMYFDTTQQKFRGYNGTAWKSFANKMFLIDTSGTLTDNLSAYWKLDEASGSARLDFWGNNILIGTGTSIGQHQSKMDYAVSLNSGNAQYLSVADNSSNSTGGEGQFAYAGWFYWTGSGQDCVYTKNDSGTDDVTDGCIGRVTANRFTCASMNTQSITWNQDLNTNTWYFFVCNYDMANNTISVSINNGVLQSNTNATVAQTDGNGPLQIGANNGASAPSSFFDGYIDELGFWKGKTLSSQERTDLYNSGNSQTLVAN